MDNNHIVRLTVIIQKELHSFTNVVSGVRSVKTNLSFRRIISKMGQLTTYTIQDIYLVSIISGILSTYFAEEIEATIESVVAYTYSANITSKKKKLAKYVVPAGHPTDTMLASFNFLGLTKINFFNIEKPLDERVI